MKITHIAFLWGIIFLTLIGIKAQLDSKAKRCSCISVSGDKIQKKTIKKLEQLPKGPGCSHIELIATMMNGTKTCLDPDSPHVQMLVKFWKKMVLKKKSIKTGNKKQQIKNAKKMKKAKHPPPRKTT
ncbi:C-X-C motif chemokine 9 [Macrotis lagotis]|uniref:C-X-C motif chemokine 9 n=1 Tax=Macrotis lagotis TaxID=92651 RepID=UPI003D694233